MGFGKRSCDICGHALPDRSGKRGRPNSFCPPEPGEKKSPCSRLAQLLVWMDTTLAQIDFEPRKAKAVKGHLLMMANQSVTRQGIPAKVQAKRSVEGEAWKTKRTVLKLSQRLVATACGMDARRLYAIESGRRPASAREREALGVFLADREGLREC